MDELIRMKAYKRDNWFSSLFDQMSGMTGFSDWFDGEDGFSFLGTYYFSHSGEKFVGGMAGGMLDDVSLVTDDGEEASYSSYGETKGIVYTFDFASLGKSLAMVFGSKWIQQARTYYFDSIYDPTESERVTDTVTHNTSDSKTYGHTRNTKTAVNQTSMTKDSTDESVYGYNSYTAVPSGKTETDGSSTLTGSADDNHSDVTEGGTDTTTRTGTDTHTVVRTGGKDIYGRFTERNRFLDTYMYQIMTKDLDSVLTLPFYKW